MTPATGARVLTVAGWLAGMCLVLAGSLILGVAALAAGLSAAGAWRRWGAGLWAGLRVAVKLRRAAKTAATTTGGSVERA
jgi:hypothetical protein